MGNPDKKDILMYCTTWCGDCKSSKQFLTRQGVVFTEKDIEKDPEAEKEFSDMVGSGPHSVPRILFRRGDPEKGMTVVKTLVEPTFTELGDTLRELGYIS